MHGAESGQGPDRDPLRPLTHGTAAAVTGAAVIVLVIVFGLLVAQKPGWDAGEGAVLQFLSRNHTALASGIALGIAWLFGPVMAIPVAAVAGAIVAVVTRSVPRTVTFLLMIAVLWGGGEVIKLVVRRARFDTALLADPLAIEHSFSYPSGHTCFVAALAAAVIFLARDQRRRLMLLGVIGAVVTATVAFSRLYLGVHYPSDVIAGIVYVAAGSMLFLAIWLGLLLPRIPLLRR